MAETDVLKEPVRLPQSGYDFYSYLKSKGTLAKFISSSLKTKPLSPETEQIINYCTPALKHGRPLNKVMIVLVGQTGSGKSTTINYLFNDNICSVNASSSETRRVTEYGKELCVTSESPPVIGLLSFVDPPGALDVDHAKEPLNLATIAKFCQEHPDLVPRKGLMNMSSKVREQVYPNLVLLNVKANDNRMDGPDSNLRKCLKALDTYGLLDRQHTNLMVVVTHSMTISKKRYMQKTYETTRTIQDAILKVLRLRDVQVVFVENVPEDYDMEKDVGCDFYQLPDGELSHYNLIKAMEAHFDRNNDVLGKLLCGWYFSDDCPEKKDKANVLQEIAHTQLSEDERGRALQDLLSMDLNLTAMQDVAAEPFRFQFLGRGYCPKSETVINVPVYSDTETKQVKLLGTMYNIPKCFETVEINKQKCYRLTCNSKEMYVKSRKASYGLEDDDKLVMLVDSAGRWLMESSSVTDSIFSVSYERRLLSVKIAKPENQMKSQLMDSINLLPVKYNENSAHAFSEFFSKWGSHFISKVWIGGDIKVDCSLDASSCTAEKVSEFYQSVQATFTGLENDDIGESEVKNDNFENFSVGIRGGDPPNVSTLNEMTLVRFNDWLQSIKRHPEELQYSFKLSPYYVLATGLRGLSFAEATQQYLDGTIPEYLPVRRDHALSRAEYGRISKELQTLPRTPSLIKRDRQIQLQKEKDCATSATSRIVKSEELVTESELTPSQPKTTQPPLTRNQVASEMVQKAKIEAKRNEKCFPPWALVYTNRGLVAISKLKPGDEVLTFDSITNSKSKKLKLTEFYTYLHYDSEKTAEFLVLHFENSRCLTITGDHLLFSPKQDCVKPVRAKDLQPGDELFRVTGFKLKTEYNQHEPVKIIKISQTMAKGVYSPLTREGTLIVDNIFASCYAHIDSHALAHATMMPLLYCYSARNIAKATVNCVRDMISFNVPNSMTLSSEYTYCGVHKYAKFLEKIRSKLPFKLFSA